MAIRIDTHGPTLGWAKCPPDIWQSPLPVTEINGQPVDWEGEWEIAPDLTHVGRECVRCGYDGQPWMMIGTVPPAPGQMFGKRRAWPVKRAFAFECPACEALTIYDRGADGHDWTPLVECDQVALF